VLSSFPTCLLFVAQFLVHHFPVAVISVAIVSVAVISDINFLLPPFLILSFFVAEFPGCPFFNFSRRPFSVALLQLPFLPFTACLITTVIREPCKTAQLIEMPFGANSEVGRRNHSIR